MHYINNMKKFALTCLLPLLALTVTAQKDYTSLVNPLIGTGGHGHTYPGASMPFGMMQLSQIHVWLTGTVVLVIIIAIQSFMASLIHT